MANETVIHRGEMVSPKTLRLRGLFFVLPGIAWIGAFLAIPCLALVVVAFAQRGGYGEVEWQFSLENLKRLLGWDLFGWSSDNIWILARSFWVALVSTLLCVLLSYPLAFFLASRPARTRTVWMTLLLIPFWTNLVIRTYAWILVLAPNMPVAKLLSLLGLIPKGYPAYPSQIAVWIGMVAAFLPFVALPLYTSVEKIDWALIEASQDLYADRWRGFWTAIFPQTLPGISVGVTLTLVPAMGMFVIPDMLGGARFMLVGNLIEQQFGSARDWPFGSMVSIALMALTLATLLIVGRTGKSKAAQA
jgi:spermidine/putrescine transport system permease protein